MPADLDALCRKIDALDPPARLRLAADLLEARQPKLAHTIASKVVSELGGLLALAKLRPDSRKNESRRG